MATRLVSRLVALGIDTPLALRDADPKQIRTTFGVVMERVVLELRGVACLSLEEHSPDRQNIMASRSFGRPVETLDEMREAVAAYPAGLDATRRAYVRTLHHQRQGTAAGVNMLPRVEPFSVSFGAGSSERLYLEKFSMAGKWAMNDDLHRGLNLTPSTTAALEAISRGTSVASMALDTLRPPETRVLREHFERQENIRRMMAGPLDALRQSELIQIFERINSYLEPMQDAIARVRELQLPKSLDIDRLLPSLPEGLGFQTLYPPLEAERIRDAMEAMRTPWLDAQNALDSVRGFAQLQHMGHALNSLPPFQDTLANALRRDLGDWRDPISWPEYLTADPTKRTAFYAEKGLDLALTDYSPQAFDQSARLAGLKAKRMPQAEEADAEPEFLDGDEEDLNRTNAAHKELHRLETTLRRFIHDLMSQVYGEDWPRHRLAPEVYEEWADRKRKAEADGGGAYPLIFYADFRDYERIICRKDDWRDIFAAFFIRPESVRESFQRLHPVRLTTMHARIVTQEDELFLMAETKRLLGAISRPKR